MASVEMVDCEATILQEIADSGVSERSIAMTYAFCMKSRENPSWSKINAAIIGRFGIDGLVWIKKAAQSGSCFL